MNDRWCAWLLVASALFDLAWRAFAAYESFGSHGATGLGVTVWNLITAGGLLRGGGGWRVFAVIRVCGGILLGSWLAFAGTMPARPWYFTLNTVWCAGLLLLLTAREPSALRRFGLVAAACAQIALLCLVLFATVMPELNWRSTIRAYSIPTRTFEDDELGYKMAIPADWVPLKSDNPLIPKSTAKGLVVDPRSRAFAAFFVEPAIGSLRSEDDYVDAAECDVRKREGDFHETSRANVMFGNSLGRRAYISWRVSGRGRRGMIAVARRGWLFYSVRTWYGEESRKRAEADIEQLHRGVTISPEASTHLSRTFLTAMRKTNPLLSGDAADRLVHFAMEFGYSLTDLRELMTLAMEGGRTMQDPKQKREMDQLYLEALGRLPGSDRTRVLAALAARNRHDPSDSSEQETADRLLVNAVNALPAERRIRFERLFNGMIDDGLLTLGTGKDTFGIPPPPPGFTLEDDCPNGEDKITPVPQSR